jgi:hypothetical protein
MQNFKNILLTQPVAVNGQGTLGDNSLEIDNTLADTSAGEHPRTSTPTHKFGVLQYLAGYQTHYWGVYNTYYRATSSVAVNGHGLADGICAGFWRQNWFQGRRGLQGEQSLGRWGLFGFMILKVMPSVVFRIA